MVSQTSLGEMNIAFISIVCAVLVLFVDRARLSPPDVLKVPTLAARHDEVERRPTAIKAHTHMIELQA